MALNQYFTQGTVGEQSLTENLIIEHVKMFGKDVYYIPRTLVKEDTIFTEDTLSAFNGAFQIEVFLEDAVGFRGDKDMFTKFGLRISDQVTFIVSRRRFTEAVDNNATLIVEGRPNEGDLIHFTMVNKTFEIQYVEHEVPFFQLGSNYVWGLRCELFEYSDENFNTGVPAVDAVELNFANATTLRMVVGGTGNFVPGETITGSVTNSTAEVKTWDPTTRNLIIFNRSGRFTIPETITGNTSLASWTTSNFNTLNNLNDNTDQNFEFETKADLILDFTEGNPFGDYGNKGGTI